jgi:SM-20-related protein
VKSPPALSAPIERPSNALVDTIVRGLAQRGHVICDQAIGADLLGALLQRVVGLPQDAFHAAGVGRAQAHTVLSQYRSDRIRWLQTEDPVEARWLAWAEALRSDLNQQLFMGLASYEAHFAHYAPGQFYKRHVDAFRGQANRVLSTVLYLNAQWSSDDGGELMLYPSGGIEGAPLSIAVTPAAGRLVVFLSEDLPHEVLSAQRDRYSIAGWYRVNADPFRA